MKPLGKKYKKAIQKEREKLLLAQLKSNPKFFNITKKYLKSTKNEQKCVLTPLMRLKIAKESHFLHLLHTTLRLLKPDTA